MVRYPFQLSNGHIVGTIETGLALLDTGCQVTLSANGEVRFLNRSHPAVGFPFEPDDLRAFVGADIDAILGMDALASAPFVVDWESGELVFGAACAGGRQLRLNKYLGLPCMAGRIGDADVRTLVDTGATFALVREHLVSRAAVAQWRDYSPLIGWYDTPLHDVTIRCGEQTLAGLTGILPEKLARLLPAIDGIIGTQMLRKGPVHFDLTRDKLTFM